MTKAECKKSKALLEGMLQERGIEYTNPASGAYRIGDVVYFYKMRGFQKHHQWHIFKSHKEFIDSL